MHGQTVERIFRDGVEHEDSFVAQQEHAKGYGGVDRVGKGSKTYGIHFKMIPWHNNIVMALLNLISHAMWIIVDYRRQIAPEDTLLQPYRIIRSDMTARKRFLLDVTRDVIIKT